jgi:hypothetical protein
MSYGSGFRSCTDWSIVRRAIDDATTRGGLLPCARAALMAISKAQHQRKRDRGRESERTDGANQAPREKDAKEARSENTAPAKQAPDTAVPAESALTRKARARKAPAKKAPARKVPANKGIGIQKQTEAAQDQIEVAGAFAFLPARLAHAHPRTVRSLRSALRPWATSPHRIDGRPGRASPIMPPERREPPHEPVLGPLYLSCNNSQ